MQVADKDNESVKTRAPTPVIVEEIKRTFLVIRTLSFFNMYGM